MEKAIIVPNGIELSSFRFDAKKREKMRLNLNLGEALTIGNVAGFRPMKNHPFMLEIMNELLKIRPDAKMIFVGDGSGFQHSVSMANNMGIKDAIKFLGNRDDVADILQAFDVFLFPSTYEGLGISVIEAQANGLPVIASDGIPKETNLTPYIKYLSLESSPQKWAEMIIEASKNTRGEFHDKIEIYNIEEICAQMARIYSNE